ncbi:MAG: Ig-like domain-containing protein, partial [Coprobacter sp.]|nr:Ig-like domain-containing protein [Coprobacter sp.]
NGGTKFTVPACKGATVSLESYNATTTTTIAGDTINQGTTTPSYTYEGDAESVEVVIGDGRYFRYIQVVLPVVATEDPEVPGDSTVVTPVAFRDIKIDLIGLMEESEIVDQTSVSYGVAVAEDGTVTRVATDDATANAVVSGKYWNSHGWVDITVTAKVDGPVKVGVGHCQFANHDATITDEAGNVTTFNVAGSACWEGAKTDDNVTFGYYTGEATTLTVKVPSYCPYVSIEAVSEVITEATVSFAMGEATAEGTLPVGDKVIVGNAFKIPTNFSLYAEGKTLTAWTDGTNNYAPGTEFTPTADVTLTPVFTENSVKFEDRTEAVTVKWDFQRNNGAPTIGVQGTGATGFWIAQAVVNGTTIDMKMDYDATNGKIANANWGDWAQINEGTKFTVPACKGATVSIESYSATTTTTIDGQTDYTASNNVVSMTLAGTAETIDIVIGDGSYHRYIQVVYPVAEKPATGKTYENEEALIVWPFNSTATAYTATPAEAFSVISTELGDITLAGTGTGQAKDDNGNTVTFLKLQPSGSTQAAKWNIKPAAGLTFTPTHISLYIQRFGTDSENGVTVTATLADGTSVNLGNYTAPRNNKSQADDKFGESANYTNKVDVTLTAEQQATLTSSEGFTLSATVGVSSTKQGGFSDIRVSGLVNGTALEVAKYTLSTATNIEGAANINVYPNVESYEAGTEVTLTATENFGYNFVSWTDAEGNVVSELPKFVYAMEADAQLTANFVQVNTYVLNVTIDGDANDYMISYDPAPTLVNGKMMYEEGTVVGIAASSNPIVTFTNWSNGETNATQTVTMNDHVLLTATYSSVDYIVGWDFITSGGNGRPADFASTVDNETTVLYLTNGSSTVGWLDKSRDAAGGYESFVGAAVNWKPLGQYWFETKLNASEFKNIRVEAELMYNYNAYTTIDIEYSTNGTDWTKAGSVTMAGAKTENPVSATLGADANNQEVLYVRFKPDTNSAVDGSTALDNDGTTITNIFICGEKEIVDDGVAPKLLSTVPTEGATGASASGKIVLNFDEKVKLTDGAKATIGDKELEGVVSGKTITFPYMALAFNSDYTFTLSANAVSDLTDNIMSEAITINFHTIAPPTVTPGMYDRIVTTVEELLAALQDASGSTRFRIFLHDGTYDLGTACLTSVPGNVSLIGESMEGTIIVNDPQAEGIGVSATLCTGGENIYMQDLTLKSTDYDRLLTTGQSMGRCVALQENASKSVYKNVRLLSNQDTYYTRATKRTYWEGGMITGTVDYLCGGGDVFFQGVTLYNNKRGSGDCITAPATSSDWGYVFNECIIDGAEEQDGNYSLGRPWQGSPRAVYINTTMKVLPSAAGWSDMGAVPGLFAEYNSHTESGAAVDCSKRKTSFSSNGQDVAVSYNPVLTAAEAAKFTVENVLGGDDNWQPQLLTEQALAPKLAISNRVITWPASNYAFCYAICKNGKVIEFTNDNTYTIPADAADTDVFSVRVANNMGGLCAASEGVVPTDEISGVEENAAEREVISTQVYDLNGIALPALRSGINIVRTIYTDGTVETVKVIVK